MAKILHTSLFSYLRQKQPCGAMHFQLLVFWATPLYTLSLPQTSLSPLLLKLFLHLSSVQKFPTSLLTLTCLQLSFPFLTLTTAFLTLTVSTSFLNFNLSYLLFASVLPTSFFPKLFLSLSLYLNFSHLFPHFNHWPKLLAKKCSKCATCKYSPTWPKFCTQVYLLICNKSSLVEPGISNF